jgi:hypothetical protein
MPVQQQQKAAAGTAEQAESRHRGTALKHWEDGSSAKRSAPARWVTSFLVRQYDAQ